MCNNFIKCESCWQVKFGHLYFHMWILIYVICGLFYNTFGTHIFGNHIWVTFVLKCKIEIRNKSVLQIAATKDCCRLLKIQRLKQSLWFYLRPYFFSKRFLSTYSNMEHKEFLSYSLLSCIHGRFGCTGGSTCSKRNDTTPCFLAMNLYVSFLNEWYTFTARWRSCGSRSGKQSLMVYFRNIVAKSRWTRLLVMVARNDRPKYRLENSTIVPGTIFRRQG